MSTRIDPKRTRSFARFTLGSLLLVMLVVCVALGWKVEQVRKQRDAVNWVQQFRGRGVDYDYERDHNGQPLSDAEPPGPKWLIKQLGIDFFHGVVRVNLTSKEEVSDVSPLVSLTSLQELQLDGTGVSDLTPLAGLSNLTRLDLSSTPVSDVTPLSGLTSLEVLHLDGTQVSDITALSSLTRLEVLRLDGTRVADVRPLAGMVNLKRLYLDGTQVTDLNELPDWWFETRPPLHLPDSRVSDVTALSGLTSLEVLHLDATQVTDVKPLAGLTNLKRLYLRSTPVDARALEKLHGALPQCAISAAYPTNRQDALPEPTPGNDRPMSTDEWQEHEMPWKPRVPKIDKGLYNY